MGPGGTAALPVAAPQPVHSDISLRCADDDPAIVMAPSATIPADKRLGPARAQGACLGMRASTALARRVAVERSIALMRDRMTDPLDHQHLARAALLSPYHYNRVFHQVTGVPPFRFLTALRMARARHLLLTSETRVTDVCYTVGFQSLGTFTTRFGQLVGVAPQQLRALALAHGERALTDLMCAPVEGHPSGWVKPWDDDGCLAIIGLFRTPVPQSLPIACSVVWAPGPFLLGPVAPGEYHILALGFPGVDTVLEAMLLTPEQLLVAGRRATVGVARLPAPAVAPLTLEPPQLVDPPVVLAAPLLGAARVPLVEAA